MGVTGLTTNFIAQKRLTWYNGWMDFQRLNDRTSWEPTLCEVVVLSSRTWIQPVYGQNRKVWEARGKGGSDPLIITPNKPSQNIFFMFPTTFVSVDSEVLDPKEEIVTRRQSTCSMEQETEANTQLFWASHATTEPLQKWGGGYLGIGGGNGCSSQLKRWLLCLFTPGPLSCLVLEVFRTLRILCLRFSCHLASNLILPVQGGAGGRGEWDLWGLVRRKRLLSPHFCCLVTTQRQQQS